MRELGDSPKNWFFNTTLAFQSPKGHLMNLKLGANPKSYVDLLCLLSVVSSWWIYI